MVLVEAKTNPDVPVLVVAVNYMVAVAVVDMAKVAIPIAALTVEAALCELSGPVAHVHSHQPIQEICKWNYLFALQMA